MFLKSRLLYLRDELWDNLSSRFQLLHRSHQTFDMGLISIQAQVYFFTMYLSKGNDANFVEEFAFQNTKS